MRDLANEGVTSRKAIHTLNAKLSHLEERFNVLTERYNYVIDTCKPYLIALHRIPDLIKEFVGNVLDWCGVSDMNLLRNPEQKIKTITSKTHSELER